MTLNAIQKWQQAARPSNPADTSLALGIFLEEVAETLEEFQQTDATHYFKRLANTAAELATFAGFLKDGSITVSLPTANRPNLTKELADVIVTAVGLGHTLDLDVPLACERVNRSNWSKFVDGMPLYADTGKVIKGPDYVPADMTGCY